ncbi:AmmeMemoRadiSam system protein A [Methylomonas sp. SURF-2]|uniref:AmmeMemoRadiSam system protein A n=1 Tax=Methylomonas subterranea TaxID=2952225 RepID=A0ABT1TKR4_9GAMM|nr:AmmeMemoRadiSam system protein A [Methylomonas sp. SURF-2]MCQ8106064.1 AmmeMemoRadiSam system protein A [Methylomonas sp. SURF-2]
MSLNDHQKAELLKLARASIQEGLRTGRPLTLVLQQYEAALTQKRASFVTLERHGQLRGCIGMLEATRPLALDIVENAYAAAFRDPRFPPLSEREYPDLDVHLSILSAAEAIDFSSEQDLIGQLRPGIDGLILREGYRRGTFLPSVWEQLADPVQFLRHLKQKAGLPADYWSDTLEIFRYGTETFP